MKKLDVDKLIELDKAINDIVGKANEIIIELEKLRQEILPEEDKDHWYD